MTSRTDGIQIYRDALVSGARTLDLGIEIETIADAMALHYALVVRWASRINLTALTDPLAAANLHGLDSLLFASLLPDAALAVTDVGSGAGFPGIVVALARPRLRMTLLEPTRKRASFLRVALADLGRADVAVVEGRLEPEESKRRAPEGSRAWPADVIISRATIPPSELIRRGAARLSPGGKIVTTSGRGAPAGEALAGEARAYGLIHEGRHRFTLPGGHTRILDVFARASDR